MLKVGYAQTTITPDLSKRVFLAGFGSNRVATEIHDPLYARALAIEQNNVQVVLVALDLLGFFRPYWQAIHQRIQGSHPQVELLGACTHTHHGPDTLGLWGVNRFTSGVDQDYIQYLIQEISTTILEALKHLQPARIKSASVQVPGIAKNARNPEIVDIELTCIQFLHPTEAKVLATLTVFPCHPEVIWDQNTQITSDYPAYLRQAFESHTNAPCLFFAGALGGMMTPDIKEHTFEEAERIGKTLAQAGIQALQAATEQKDPALTFRRKEFTIPVKNIIFRTASWMGILPRGFIRKGKITTETQLLKLGNTCSIGVPGELLPGLGLEIKKMLRNHGTEIPAVIGLANDELGYILPENEYRFPGNPFSPGDHYEETMSVGPQAGTLLMEAVRDLLN